MTTDPGTSRLVVPESTELHGQLHALARAPRLVFFAGLPGTGKSLLIHQLAHLADAAHRRVHLLQWDTARPVFEASPAGSRYPVTEGVTHAAIRKAVGLWVRRAVVEWERRHPEPEHLLVGETPLVGNRFIELAQTRDDAAEPLLTAPATRFVIPVPSREVRRFLEAERARRAAQPRHQREREDAPPRVLRDLWREIAGVAVALGVAAGATAPAADGLYDPQLYQRVYQRVLRHRRTEVLSVRTRYPTGALSVYDFAVARHDLLPTPDDVDSAIRDVERRYADPERLRREVDGWYIV